jgi:hypothetical protein
MSQISDTAVINATGGLVELGYDELTSNVTVTATTAAGGHIVGDVTFVSDGSPIYVQFDAGAVSPPTGSGELMHFALEVDGSVTKDYWCSSRNVAAGGSYLDQTINNAARLSLSAGSHNVKIRAWGDGTTGVINASTSYGNPLTRVSKVITASEWPAINEQNRIICTSSTRPSAPYEGIKIYETDTNRELVYDSTAWVSPPTVYEPPMLIVNTTSGGQVAYDTTNTNLYFDTVTVNTDGIHPTGSANTLTIQRAGVYLVNAMNNWSGVPNTRADLWIVQSSGGTIARDIRYGSVEYNEITYTYKFAEGDTLSAWVWQDNTTNVSHNANVQLSVMWLGKA